MNTSREQKIRSVIRQSQPDLTIILENIFDPLNISAALRSCDAVGVREIFVVYTRKYLDKRGLRLGKRTSGGAFKWIDVYLFEDLEECFSRVRTRYGRILSTGLGTESRSLYSLDLTQPTALLFGNEDEGVSAEAIALCDGNFNIPQAGFAESLNISVACAVSLFEARRQRELKGFYSDNQHLDQEQQEQLFNRWSAMLKEKKSGPKNALTITKDSPDLLPVFAERDPDNPFEKPARSMPLSRFDL